jgi:hypothetical protein
MAIGSIESDNGTQIIAIVVGALALFVIALFGFGAFNLAPSSSVILSIDRPGQLAPPTPSETLSRGANA